jgi:hypothetical protein
MRQKLGSGLCRYEHIAVLITEISAPAIAASGSVVVMQLEYASRNHVTNSLRQREPSVSDQGANSFERGPYQSVGVDGITHDAVIGLVLAKRGVEQYQFPTNCDPRGGPGGYSSRRFR